MQQRDPVVPLCAYVDAEAQGMIFRNTKEIRARWRGLRIAHGGFHVGLVGSAGDKT
jgi:hypothetical protein